MVEIRNPVSASRFLLQLSCEPCLEHLNYFYVYSVDRGLPYKLFLIFDRKLRYCIRPDATNLFKTTAPTFLHSRLELFGKVIDVNLMP